MSRIFAICILTTLFLCRMAAAHFVWLDVEPADEPTAVNLWFAEECEPGEAKLLDKVAQTKVWMSAPRGKAQPLTLEKHVDVDKGSWTAKVQPVAPCCLSAKCDYGVVSRDGETFLLQYAARRILIKRAEELSQAIDAESLPLEVQTGWKDGNLHLAVVFEGKPAADAQLIAYFPDKSERELKLDSNGGVNIERPAAGKYAFRACVKAKTSGEKDGKHYDQVRHYSTLALRMPVTTEVEGAGADAAKPSKVAVEAPAVDAVELLRRARENRAVWEHFTGFSADVTVRIDGQMEQGSLVVDEHGSATTKIKDDKMCAWVEQQMGSLADHRLPAGFDDEKPTFADDDMQHPLGRLIRLGDANYESSYRIRDDVVTEVDRRAGPDKFSVSIFEVDRNKEGKYLPHTFCVTFWNAKTNEIKSSISYLNTWKRVGTFDLPQRVMAVETVSNGRHVKEITFDNYRLTESSK